MARVIVIEDDEVYRTFLNHRLKTFYPRETFNFVGSGEAALKIIDDETIIVIVDYDLEGISGLETTEQIKELYPKMEIIFLTGTSLREVEKEGCELGAFDFIKKGGLHGDEFHILKKSMDILFKIDDLRREMQEMVNTISIKNILLGKNK